jgi:hypothetical protein
MIRGHLLSGVFIPKISIKTALRLKKPINLEIITNFKILTVMKL